MRKTYQKPEIMFEDFSVSVSIAGTCEVKTNTPSLGQCGKFFMGVGNVFTTAIPDACSDFAINPDDFYNDTICYHVPVENNNLFNS